MLYEEVCRAVAVDDKSLLRQVSALKPCCSAPLHLLAHRP